MKRGLGRGWVRDSVRDPVGLAAEGWVVSDPSRESRELYDAAKENIVAFG